MTRLMRSPFALVGLVALLSSLIAPCLATNASAFTAYGNGNARIALHACPDGAKPWLDPSPCTVIEDDGVEYLSAENLSTSRLTLKDDSRDENGAYHLTSLGEGARYYLHGFEPIRKQHVYMSGVYQEGSAFYITPVSGKTLDVNIYYYNGMTPPRTTDGQTHTLNDGSAPRSRSATDVVVAMRGCPDGVNPARNPELCTEVIEDDGTEYLLLTRTGQRYMLLDDSRDANGDYHLGALSGGTYEFHGFEPHKYAHMYVTGATEPPLLTVTEGQVTRLVFYYYNG